MSGHRRAARTIPAMALAAIVGRETETNTDLAREWGALALDVRVLPPESAVDFLRAGDVALGRIDVRSSIDGIDGGMLELLQLMRRGVSVLNPPAALLNTHDKLRTARLLASAGVPHPVTEHVTSQRPLPELRPPLVLKPRFGSWGADVVRCDSSADVRAGIEALSTRPWFRTHGALAQTLVPPSGHDLRVLVAGGRVVGAESRISAPGEWRTNVSLGGSIRPAVPPASGRAVALAAAKSVGGDFVGIDLLPSERGYVVIEVNGAVDFDTAYSLPGRNVFADLARALGLVQPRFFSQVALQPLAAGAAARV